MSRRIEMKVIKTNAKLEKLHSNGKGLIYNEFSRGGPSGKDYNVLHAASCSWVVRSNVNVPKYFFNNVEEATKWLRANRGGEGKTWKRCGTCQARAIPAARISHESYDKFECAPMVKRVFSEAEAEKILIQYLRYNSYSVGRQVQDTSGIIDVVADGSDGHWFIEVKGEDRGGYPTAEMNFRVGLGQLMSRMNKQEAKYGLAFPLTQDFVRVLQKCRDSRAFEKLGIYLVPVKRDGSCRLISPIDIPKFLMGL